MRITRVPVMIALVVWIAAAVRGSDISREQLKAALQKNPDILIEAIVANKKAILAILNQAAIEEQARVQKEAEEAEKKAYEDAFKNLSSPRSTIRPVSAAKKRPGTPWSSTRTFNVPTVQPAIRTSRS